MCPLGISLSSISNSESFPVYPCYSTLYQERSISLSNLELDLFFNISLLSKILLSKYSSNCENLSTLNSHFFTWKRFYYFLKFLWTFVWERRVNRHACPVDLGRFWSAPGRPAQVPGSPRVPLEVAGSTGHPCRVARTLLAHWDFKARNRCCKKNPADPNPNQPGRPAQVPGSPGASLEVAESPGRRTGPL
jgi:hypothetical protein